VPGTRGPGSGRGWDGRVWGRPVGYTGVVEYPDVLPEGNMVGQGARVFQMWGPNERDVTEYCKRECGCYERPGPSRGVKELVGEVGGMHV
jgi:hypothetical protein